LRPPLPSKLDGLRYVAGHPGGEGAIRLNTNELPYPPSVRVRQAIDRAGEAINGYPHPAGEPLRSQLARHHGLSPENILVGAGADGLLDTVFRAFLSAGDVVGLTRPAYPVMPVLCAVYAVRTVVGDWPVREPYDAGDAVVSFVANPNSPTGQWLSPPEFEDRFGSVAGLLVIDEAYAPFTGHSMVDVLGRHPNWIVVRTFSKGYALAGLRVGYAVAAPELVDEMAGAQLPYPVSTVALRAAGAALADDEHNRSTLQLVLAERERLVAGLTGHGWHCPASQANFVYARPPSGDAATVHRELARRHVLVRYFPAIDETRVRISVGTAAETDSLLSHVGALAAEEAL
jgi:histidinol-phosphate aminotransferase